MIIPSFVKKNLNQKKYSHLLCPHCKSQGGINISTFFRYLSILWIPFFAFQKGAQVLCYNCKNEVFKKDQSREIKLAVSNLKSSKGIPAWAFIGAILIATNFIVSEILLQSQDQKNLELLANPQANDVYGYLREDKKISIYKVIIVEADTVFISPNKYKIQEKDKLENLDQDTYYKNYYFPKTKDELLKMYEQEIIFKVLRK